MPTNTYVALDKVTVGTAVSFITFSSIPATYTDLVIVAAPIYSTSAASVLTLNSDTTSNYSATWLYGDGTSAGSFRVSNTTLTMNYFNNGSTATPNQIINIQNYANTTTFKTILIRSNNAAAGTDAAVALWRATPAAINTVKIATSTGNFAVGSTFSLYGIASAEVGAKATGGTIYSDSQYFYHAFAANGTFTPTQSITADVLVVAGGGGAGSDGAGGGGAGGLLAFTSQSLTATGYTCTVGGGGAGGTSNTSGTVGVDSQFGALTLVKGGGAGIRADVGGNGGSGGGGSGRGKVTGNNPVGGTATSGQGNAGGAGAGSSSGGQAGGGGGGAGAVGAAAAIGAGGNGGVGLSTYSSWGVATGFGQNVSGTYFLAGGGGGSYEGSGSLGTGGNGGGGAATSTTTGTAGIANTGGGGGAAITGFTAGAGGSGIVIVRYAK